MVTFLFGDRPAGTGSDLDRFINLVASGIKFGSVIALAAVGLSLIFGVTGLVNFAHGELVAFGAVFAWFLNASAGGPELWLVWATPLATNFVSSFPSDYARHAVPGIRSPVSAETNSS